MRSKGQGHCGMSLVEATIILMIIATLTAVIGPSIGDYIEDARRSAARRDTETIATALTRMLADTGEAWFVRNGARTGTATDQGAPSHLVAARVDMMISDGAVPTLSATPRSSGTDWDDVIVSDTGAIQ